MFFWCSRYRTCMLLLLWCPPPPPLLQLPVSQVANIQSVVTMATQDSALPKPPKHYSIPRQNLKWKQHWSALVGCHESTVQLRFFILFYHKDPESTSQEFADAWRLQLWLGLVKQPFPAGLWMCQQNSEEEWHQYTESGSASSWEYLSSSWQLHAAPPLPHTQARILKVLNP